MDTTYVSTMLVVFLVLASLAVSIGYLYVDEEDMRTMAEMSALTGTQNIKKRMLDQLGRDPGGLPEVSGDTVQAAARNAVIDQAMGEHREAALLQSLNNNSNSLSTGNDMTVGFWNSSSHSYTPGGTPVNAMQVRIRRTAESDAAGIGKLGDILGIIAGVQKFDYTPDAIAALSPKATASFALCADSCAPACSFPNVCPLPERKMVSEPWGAGTGNGAGGGHGNSYLPYQLNSSVTLSDMVCLEATPGEVCKREIITTLDPQQTILRDMEAMMYNPDVDAANKEYDPVSGRVTGWWVIAPVTECQGGRRELVLQGQTVTRYALIRITRICAPGPAGCRQNSTPFEAPAAVCGADKGLYIDRISCVNCGSRAMLAFPGLQPVLVNQNAQGR